jgi:eukaryotic-like serine/threonine-protein kinase
MPYGFTPDGRLLLGEVSPDLGARLAMLAMNGDRRITPLMRTTFNVGNGEISPDGRWLAYESDESGREEIYVRPFPEVDGGRWQVSTGGGRRPVWAPNGRELFYQGTDGMVLGVAVTAEGRSFRGGSPAKVVEARYFMGDTTFNGRTYDVASDGQRFLMIKAGPIDEGATPPHLVVVQNWFEELKRRVPRN